jgi:hypothetical protein
MERTAIMMVMMDGAMVAEKVVFSPQKEEDWPLWEPEWQEDAQHFFY